MHPAQVFKAHHAVELGKGGGGCLFAAQIVTGGKRVTGINTDADAGFILHALDDRRQMLKPEAEVAALTGGVLNHCGDAFGLRQRNVDGFGNAREALLFRDLLQVAAGVEIEQRQPKLLTAGKLINKRLAGFLQRLINRMTEVNQVAVVGQDLRRGVVVRFARGFERINRFRG